MEFTLQDDQPQLLTNKQELALEEKKNKILAACKKCNKSGYLPGDKMCECLTSIMIEYRLLCSNIPVGYQHVTWDMFQAKTDPGFIQIKQYVAKLKNARDKGIGLHIYTKKPGSGKTLLATCVLHEAMKQGYFVYFTTLEQLSKDIKLGFKDKAKRARIDWAMFKTDFIFVDEMAKFQSTDWKDAEINDFFQRRVNEKLPVLTTENLSIEELTAKYPEHLISRFAATQYEITFNHAIEYRRDVQKKNLLKELME